MESKKYEIATIVAVQFNQNSYIAHLEGREDCLVIDPGLEPEKILDHLDSQGLVPAAILNTHGHIDHIGGNGALKTRWPECPLVIGVNDADMLSSPADNLSAELGMPVASPAADIAFEDGDVYAAAGFLFEIRHVPGHTTGHVVYVCRDHGQPLVFVGDVIFASGIGRTDFPGGDLQQLLDNIRNKIFDLPDKTVLLSGHGPPTTVGQEKQANPFVGESA